MNRTLAVGQDWVKYMRGMGQDCKLLEIKIYGVIRW